MEEDSRARDSSHLDVFLSSIQHHSNPTTPAPLPYRTDGLYFLDIFRFPPSLQGPCFERKT